MEPTQYFIKAETGLPGQRFNVAAVITAKNEKLAKNKTHKQFEYSGWFWANGEQVSFEEYNAHDCNQLKAKGAAVKFFTAVILEFRIATKQEISTATLTPSRGVAMLATN